MLKVITTIGSGASGGAGMSGTVPVSVSSLVSVSVSLGEPDGSDWVELDVELVLEGAGSLQARASAAMHGAEKMERDRMSPSLAFGTDVAKLQETIECLVAHQLESPPLLGAGEQRCTGTEDHRYDRDDQL